MILGTALIIGGLWWAHDLRHRPGHTRRDFRGPAIMASVGLAWLLFFLFLASRW